MTSAWSGMAWSASGRPHGRASHGHSDIPDPSALLTLHSSIPLFRLVLRCAKVSTMLTFPPLLLYLLGHDGAQMNYICDEKRGREVGAEVS